MQKELIDHWRRDIVDDWRSELAGPDLLCLQPSAAQFTFALSLRADGTAAYDFIVPNYRAPTIELTPPFPVRWKLSDDRVLSISLPIAPMPEYGQPDWFTEENCYDVLSVTDRSLAISDRRFDGEQLIVLRRVDVEAYWRRKWGQTS